jgi:hypothetical protein
MAARGHNPQLGRAHLWEQVHTGGVFQLSDSCGQGLLTLLVSCLGRCRVVLLSTIGIRLFKWLGTPNSMGGVALGLHSLSGWGRQNFWCGEWVWGGLFLMWVGLLPAVVGLLLASGGSEHMDYSLCQGSCWAKPACFSQVLQIGPSVMHSAWSPPSTHAVHCPSDSPNPHQFADPHWVLIGLLLAQWSCGGLQRVGGSKEENK